MIGAPPGRTRCGHRFSLPFWRSRRWSRARRRSRRWPSRQPSRRRPRKGIKLASQPASRKPARLSVGGQASIYYLPLTVADRLGYLKDAGLDVEITDLQGGARALQALMGGSADVVTGAYDHAIQMHAKGQPIVAVVQLGRFPGFALGVVASKAAAYRSPLDLKGMKIGVTAPGSSTHFMAAYMLVRNGLAADDASFIGVGVRSTPVAAVRR